MSLNMHFFFFKKQRIQQSYQFSSWGQHICLKPNFVTVLHVVIMVQQSGPKLSVRQTGQHCHHYRHAATVVKISASTRTKAFIQQYLIHYKCLACTFFFCLHFITEIQVFVAHLTCPKMDTLQSERDLLDPSCPVCPAVHT